MLWFGAEDGDSQAPSTDRSSGEFDADMERAAAGHLAELVAHTARQIGTDPAAWISSPATRFSGTARAFATDSAGARPGAGSACGKGLTRWCSLAERLFFYLPAGARRGYRGTRSAVSPRAQRLLSMPRRRSARYFEECARYAEQHRDIVRRFGRFPHRNAILGRAEHGLRSGTTSRSVRASTSDRKPRCGLRPCRSGRHFAGNGRHRAPARSGYALSTTGFIPLTSIAAFMRSSMARLPTKMPCRLAPLRITGCGFGVTLEAGEHA